MKVRVGQPCAKDLAACEEMNDPATHHHNTKCEASKSNKPYYVQYNMEDDQESMVNRYKQKHFQHNCKFVEDNQQNRKKLFERNDFQKGQHVSLEILNHLANAPNQKLSKSKQKDLKAYKLGNSSSEVTAIKPKDSSSELKETVDKTINFIERYLGYTENDENSLESLPFLKLLEDNNERI